MKNDPRIIKARFGSVCAETGEVINKGETILFYPLLRQVFKLGTKQHQEYKEWLFDIEVLSQNY